MKPSSVTALSRGYCRDFAMDHTGNCDLYEGKSKQSYSPVSVQVEDRYHANTDSTPPSVTALSRGYCRDTAMDHTRNCDSYVGKCKQSYSPVSVRVEGRQHANTDIVNAATVRENTPAMSAPRNAPFSPGQHLDLPSSFERTFSQDSRNISLLRSSAPPKKHGTWCRFKKSLKSMFGRGPSPKPPPSFASHRASAVPQSPQTNAPAVTQSVRLTTTPVVIRASHPSPTPVVPQVCRTSSGVVIHSALKKSPTPAVTQDVTDSSTPADTQAVRRSVSFKERVEVRYISPTTRKERKDGQRKST